MDPTSLPTDNLYKFLALAGLMLAGFCTWGRWKLSDDRLSETAHAMADLVKVAGQGTATPEQRAELDAARIRSALVIGRWKPGALYLRFYWIGVVAGLVLAGLGFYEWYVNVQWYTDKQTKADFEDHMAELAAKRIARARAAVRATP